MDSEADSMTLQQLVSLLAQVLKRAGVTGFQIRAMDAAVCALWAVCRHWHDPKAAIIAAVRGVAYGVCYDLRTATQLVHVFRCSPHTFPLFDCTCRFWQHVTWQGPRQSPLSRVTCIGRRDRVAKLSASGMCIACRSAMLLQRVMGIWM